MTVLEIAKETGWAEENILTMPLEKIIEYRHAIMCSRGIETIFTKDHREKLASRAKILKSQFL